MKYIFLLLLAVLFSCRNNGEPFVVPLEPEHVWLDQTTKSDTIITGEGYTAPNFLYYAAKNWQTAADTGIEHGYRKIAIRYGDSILVNALNDVSTNYDGPFFFHVDENKTNPACAKLS